jgi:hypothetical protein
MAVRLILATAWLLFIAWQVRAADHYVSPQGTSDGKGTKESPWDIASALAGKQKIAAGDTIWIAAGTYKKTQEAGGLGYQVHLAGAKDAPIQVRGLPGQRITIDGGLVVQEPSTYLWLRDLEILVSEPSPDKPIDTSARPKRPWGGLSVYSGSGCKFINLVIHDNCQGVSWWVGSVDSELYGCLIYNNGWPGTDRGHGHAVYTQNKDGTKVIADCIMTGGHGFSMHAYGSGKAYVDNFLVEGNIVYDAGRFLIGGGRPSHRIRSLSNYLYKVDMQIGYGARNDDCEVRDNVIAGGILDIQKYDKVVKEGNLVLAKDAARPKENRVVLRINKYEPQRANLAIFNWEKKAEVEVDTGAFLKAGERYRLLNPRDFYGKPIASSTAEGKTIRVPVAGEFGAFVLVNEGAK